ncbi:hypothetical protein BGZ74_007994 [Mortierella antarctica]|nr:hypothetical protein BGZ74_007994 [Mortierella antarctica]
MKQENTSGKAGANVITRGSPWYQYSTSFLIGPAKQIKTMFAPVRMIASIVFIAMMLITLIVAFTLHNPALLCIILCIIQFLALFWYSASYIPYGRAAIRKVVGGCIEV